MRKKKSISCTWYVYKYLYACLTPDANSGRKYKERLDAMSVLQRFLYFRPKWYFFLAPSTVALFSLPRSFPYCPFFSQRLLICVCVFSPLLTLYIYLMFVFVRFVSFRPFCSFLFILLIFVHFVRLSYANEKNRQDEHEGASPLQLLRRVREGGMWWLLVEYDDEYETQGWKGFADESAVAEFSQVNVGEPLEIPPVSLSPEESATVVSRSGGCDLARIRQQW